MNTGSNQYLAGFFDGEGYISILHNFILHCGATQKDDLVLKILKRRFGGSIVFCHREAKDWRPESSYYEWSIAARKALKFLKVISPYLIEKKEKARKALKLYEIRDNPSYRLPQKKILYGKLLEE